jgi:hypothetical protein
VVNAKQFLKLGTSLRYLIDAREGQPLAGKFILQNLRTVLELVTELGFVGARHSKGFEQLQLLQVELHGVCVEAPKLTEAQAQRLELAARKLREALFTEGDQKELVSASQAELAVPAKVTLRWVWAHVPLPAIIAAVVVPFSAFAVGIGATKVTAEREFFSVGSEALTTCTAAKDELTKRAAHATTSLTRLEETLRACRAAAAQARTSAGGSAAH